MTSSRTTSTSRVWSVMNSTQSVAAGDCAHSPPHRHRTSGWPAPISHRENRGRSWAHLPAGLNATLAQLDPGTHVYAGATDPSQRQACTGADMHRGRHAQGTAAVMSCPRIAVQGVAGVCGECAPVVVILPSIKSSRLRLRCGPRVCRGPHCHAWRNVGRATRSEGS